MEQTVVDFKPIEHSLNKVLLADRYAIKKSLRVLKDRVRQGKPVDHGLKKLEQRIARSIEIVEKRKTISLNLSYPQALPVSQRKVEIIKAIQEHQVVIIAGETGSGKTTQIPKMCLEAGLGIFGVVGHTQPRRLAARTVSNRIAEELQTPLGQGVGFKVRFQDSVSDSSRIKLMTDGMLLAEVQNDRLLNQYDALIIDEAHERSLNIDFLLGYLRSVLAKRPDLKLIITSATIDHQRFSEHFSKAPIIEVSGRTFPVDVLYRPMNNADETEAGVDAEQGLEDAILESVTDILQLERKHPNPNRPGDILVFLSGEREIREAAEVLRKKGPKNIEVLPLYSRLSNSEQNRVFQKHSGRRIVLATNVAETSITVPNIGYVIDCGLARINRYSFRSKVQRLPIEPISQASANQRKGRCGRVAEGVCIRLYAEDDFNLRPEFTEPEILRTNLASVILQMESMQLGHIERFPFIDKPDSRMISDGYRLLEELGAYDKAKGLTVLGKQIAKLPVDPRVGRMIVAAQQMGCLSEVLTIASALSVQDPWMRPYDKQQAADAAHSQFKDKESDFYAYVNLWQRMSEERESLSNNQFKRWLSDNYLSYLRIREWRDLHRQLKLVCTDQGWKENAEPSDPTSVHKAILSGLLSHVGVKDEDRQFLGTRNRKFQLFPGSSLKAKRSKWVMAAEIVETQKVYARTLASIEPQWIEELGKHLLKFNYFEPHWEKKRACAIAYRQTTFMGLIINPRQAVQYSQVDPAESREIFIMNALVAGDYESKAPFLKHNQQLIEELTYLEQKTRRRDILLDDLSIYQIFDKLIPADIVNGKSFEKWRKGVEKTEPQRLFLTEQQLTRASELGDQASWSFPDQVEVLGGNLKLDYEFEPGRKNDGLTVVVPVSLLNQVDDAKLEWLVPGLEHEKCVALIKALPKALRKNFVPAPDYAKAFLETNPNREQSLHEQLAAFLKQKSRQDVRAELWDDLELPLHLLANLRVLNEQGKLLREGRDIRPIKRELSGAVQAAIKDFSVEGIENKVYTQWSFERVPEEYQLKRAGAIVITYPALVDVESGVELAMFDTREQADKSMQQATLRLFLLALPQQSRYVRKNCALPEKTAIKYSAFGDKHELIKGIERMAFFKTFVENKPLVRSCGEFEKRLTTSRDQLVAAANSIKALLADILDKHHVVSKLLSASNSPARLKGYQDIQFQLKNLFVPNWVSVVDFDNLAHYPRYLDAIAIRIDRMQGNIQRDQAFSEDLAERWEAYESRQARRIEEGIRDLKLEQYRWMLEEYRISLFAQEMKTAYPISEKRLEKFWQTIAR